MRKEKKSVKIKLIALSAMFSALGTVILFLGGMLGDLDMTVCALASLIVLVAIIEMGVASGIMVYAVTSALALILFPMYFITPLYVLFIGFYPLLKYFAEKQRTPVAWLIKLTVLNLMTAVLLLLAYYVYGINIYDVGIGDINFGKWAILVLYVLVNITVAVFDYCITNLTKIYNFKLRKIFKIYKFLK